MLGTQVTPTDLTWLINYTAVEGSSKVTQAMLYVLPSK